MASSIQPPSQHMAGSTSEDRTKKKPVCRSLWLRRQRIAKWSQHGSRVSLAKKRARPCGQADISEIAKSAMPVLDLDKLPEDILHHIHSFVPLRDAARAACVSRRFLHSWRRFPNLTCNWKSLGMKIDEPEMPKKLVDRIHSVLVNHSGSGVKKLKLYVGPCRNVITANHLSIWLQAAVKSGIKELVVDLPLYHGPEFNFSCSLLSCAAGSLQLLSLSSCDFHPTLMIGCLRNLKAVCLTLVNITEEELGCFLSCTPSLDKLEVSKCNEIAMLKIPSHLQQLYFLRVFLCEKLQMIEIYAPNITTFVFRGPPVKIFISDSSLMKKMIMNGCHYSGTFRYALTKLHSIASNLQTLTLLSSGETSNMPAPSDKFLHLRTLNIHCSGIPGFDYFSLAPFLEACPALEDFFLSAARPYSEREQREQSILEDPNADSLLLRRIPEFHLDNLKKVSITGFWSSKSLIELTCQILETSGSLHFLVLDTTNGYDNSGICSFMVKKAIMEALRGVEAVRKYVYGKVPSSVNLELLEPCDRCHISKL